MNDVMRLGVDLDVLYSDEPAVGALQTASALASPLPRQKST
jgi:hypothetical protein